MNKIDWSKWSAIAEVMSSVAIFVTLIYLVIQTQQLQTQTQQNTDALLANSRQASLDTELAFIYETLDRPFLGGPTSGYAENELTEEQLRQYRIAATALFRMRESQFLQYQSGAMDSDIWASYRAVLVTGLRAPEMAVFRSYWDETSRYYDSGFRDEIESQLTD